jgi:RimJ/RimL family protein N-acetyltransferase
MGRRACALVDGRGTERVSIYLMRKNVQLRPARQEDARQAWEWRNETSIRRSSLDPAPLSWHRHVTWWENAIKAADRRLLVAHFHNQVVGILRFDKRDDEVVVVSIYLDPGLAGLGLGRFILRAGELWLRTAMPMVRTIRAEILSNNLASVRSFEAAGYSREAALSVWIRALSAP